MQEELLKFENFLILGLVLGSLWPYFDKLNLLDTNKKVYF